MSLLVIAASAVDAIKDRNALIRRGVNGTRRLVTTTALRNAGASLFVTAVIAVTIVWSEWQAPGAADDELRSILHVRDRWIAVCVVILAVNAGWGLKDAARLRQKVAEGAWEPPPGR